jgi:HK97 family phage portal protein
MRWSRWVDRLLAAAALAGVLLAAAGALAQSPGNFSTLSASGTATLNGAVLICSGMPWLDVKCPGMAGGAVGDDNHDDTSAINTAIATAVSHGWPLHIPAGTYKVTSQLTVDYAGMASSGFRVISEGAVLDGRTIASGPVLQVECSGGSHASPASCFYFHEQGTLSVWGNSGAQNLATLTSAESTAATVLPVSTTAPFFAGETVIVALTGGGTFASPVASIGSGTITLVNPLPGGASVNAAVSIASYPFMLGKYDFSDAHNAIKIDHLLVNNASTSAGAGGCQFNYLLDSDVFAVCVSGGGAAGLALEQAQFSRFSGAGTAQGTGGAGLVLENGFNISNLFSALDLEVSPTCLSITDQHDGMNSWVSPYFNCNTAVSAVSSTHNVLINPTYGGNVVNRGPQSQSIQIIGTGNRVPWQYPSAASYVASGVDSGTVVSSANATGSSLAVTLPNPNAIDNGWWMGFATDNSKGLSLTAPSGVSILLGNKFVPSLAMGPGNYEYIQLQSDGSNFRVVSSTRNTRLLGGFEAAAWPGNAWLFPSSSGYSAGLGDNGNVLSSFNAISGLTVTLPSTTSLTAGWAFGLTAENGRALTVNVNGTAGGSILYPRTVNAGQTSFTLAGHNYEFVALQYDGAGNFRVVQATPSTAQQIGVAMPAGIANWLFPSLSAYTASEADNGNAISSFNSPLSYFALTLPATSTITAGWTIAIASDNGKATSVQVNGGAGEKILVPGTLGAKTSLPLSGNSTGYELAWLQFDGSNFRLLAATPLTANADGMTTLIGTRRPVRQLARPARSRPTVLTSTSAARPTPGSAPRSPAFEGLKPMPPDGGKRTPIASYSWGQQGLEAQFHNVFQPDQGIFSPGYPLAPPEPERLRLWDFPVGVNTIYTPRSYEAISFTELRALADAHDITRLAIETRKDQVEKLDWVIKPIAQPQSRRGRGYPDIEASQRAAQVAEFWRRPDGERPFATWLRELLEDVLVLDAPALEVRRSRGGDLVGLDVVDGATFKLLFDETGRRPRPPAPAFEQVIHGRPWKLLTAEELIYLPRNPRPHKAYGFGPVEQIVMTVNIGLRRQVMQLQHFTEGNVPPGLLNAPDGWSAEQIRQFQDWFDSVLAGNTGSRTRLVWGPAGTHYQAFKEVPYKDEFDEWLARIVCYAFSLPPSAFVRQMNRATADTAQEAALAEGLAPLMGWVKRLCDHVIQDRMGHRDLEFVWLDAKPADPAEQAKLIDTYVRTGIYTVNEARDLLGLDPVAGGDAAMIYGTTGAVPLAPTPSLTGPQPAAAKRVAAGMAALRKYDPDEPRVPAGNPDGGQWTAEGGDASGASSGGGTRPGLGGWGWRGHLATLSERRVPK